MRRDASNDATSRCMMDLFCDPRNVMTSALFSGSDNSSEELMAFSSHGDTFILCARVNVEEKSSFLASAWDFTNRILRPLCASSSQQ